MSARKRINVTLPAKLIQRMRLRCEQDGAAMSWAVEAAIELYLTGYHPVLRKCRACKRSLPLDLFDSRTTRPVCLECLPRCTWCGEIAPYRGRVTCSPKCAEHAQIAGISAWWGNAPKVCRDCLGEDASCETCGGVGVDCG
jgi:hypothetical protein